MVIIDSSVWIEALRREGDLFAKCAVESLLDEYEATLCAPVRLEVLGGARQTDRKTLDEYFSVLPFLKVRDEDWIEATRNAWRLADSGIRVPWFDLLIATIGIRTGCRVYSIDKHFRRMAEHPPLMLYEPGYGGSFTPEE